MLSRVPCAMQQVLVDYMFYVQQSVYVNPNLLNQVNGLKSHTEGNIRIIHILADPENTSFLFNVTLLNLPPAPNLLSNTILGVKATSKYKPTLSFGGTKVEAAKVKRLFYFLAVHLKQIVLNVLYHQQNRGCALLPIRFFI